MDAAGDGTENASEAPSTGAGPADTVEIGRYGPFAIAIMTMCLVAFPIAFNLGAYGVVFYDDVFRFVVAATAGLAVSLITEPYEVRRHWLGTLALAAPAAWLIVAVLTTDSVADAATNPILGTLALVIGVVAVPAVLRMVILMFTPGFRTYRDRRLLTMGVGVVVLIAATGYFVGVNNDKFLTCGDFKVAGSDEPKNCDPTDPD